MATPFVDLEMTGGMNYMNGRNNPHNCSTYGRVLTYKDSKKSHPWLILAFAMIHIIFFFIVLGFNYCPKTEAGKHGDCVPKAFGRFSFQFDQETSLGMDYNTLLKFGGISGRSIDNEKWKVLVSFWLHKDLWHLFINLISVLIVGIPLEQEYGQVRVGIIYIFSGIGGSMLYGRFVSEMGLCTAAPLFGLIGATFADLLTNLLINHHKSYTFWKTVAIILINVICVLRGPPEDVFGGCLTGLVLGFLLLPRPQYEAKRDPTESIISYARKIFDPFQFIYFFLSLTALIAAIVISIELLKDGFHS